MRKALITLGLLAAAVSACATKPSYSESLQPWIGASSNELARVWGSPHGDRIDADGRRTYIYVKSRVYSVPLGNSDHNETVRLSCETSFYLSEDGTIERIDWRGEICGAGALTL